MNYVNRLQNRAADRGGRRPTSPSASRRIVRDIEPPQAAEHSLRERLPGMTPSPVRPKAAAPEPELSIRTWQPEAVRRGRLRRRIAIALVVAGLLAGFLLPTIVYPSITITVTPKIESLAIPPTELGADTTLAAPDPAAKQIPALAVAAEKTLSAAFPSSGKQFVQERAQGKAKIYNAFSSAPQPLVAQTRFQEASGKVFRLRRAVTVPGAEVREGKIVPTWIEAEVAADRPGEAYNIGPTDFRIPGFRGTPRYEGFTAKSEAQFSGGFEGEARTVRAEDLTSASEELTRRISDELRRELGEKAPSDPDFLVPDGAREIAIASVEQPKIGERHDTFETRVTARGRLLAVRRSQLAELVGAIALPGDAPLPARIPARQDELAITVVRLGAEAGTVRIAVSGKLAFWRETKLDELVATLRTSTPAKAEAYLRGREEIASFRVKRFPRWLWFIPTREGGLRVAIEPPA